MRERWDWSVTLVIAVVIVVLLAVSFYGAVKLSKAECVAKTENIGFSSRWSPLGDCQIEVAPGQWIPLDNYYFRSLVRGETQ